MKKLKINDIIPINICKVNSTKLNELILRGTNQGWDKLVIDNLYKNLKDNEIAKGRFY